MARASNDEEDGIISGINVTPLVDVVLVLLIIFMVTAKIIVSQGMPMDLPKAAGGEEIQTIFSIELAADGKTRVNAAEVPGDDAIGALAKEARTKNRDLRAVIRADRKVEHGRVIHVLDVLKRAGVAKIAFAVSPMADDGKPPAKPAP